MYSCIRIVRSLFYIGILLISSACKTKKSRAKTITTPPPPSETCVANLSLVGENKVDPSTLRVTKILVEPVENLGQMRVQINYNAKTDYDVAWFESCLESNPKSCVTRIGQAFTMVVSDQERAQVNLEDGFLKGTNKITAELCVFSNNAINASKDYEKPFPSGYPHSKGVKLYCGKSSKSSIFSYTGWSNSELQKLQAAQRGIYDKIFSEARTLQGDLFKYLQDKGISTSNPSNNLNSFDRAAVNIVNLKEKYGLYLASLEFESNLPSMYAGLKNAQENTSALKLTSEGQETDGCVTEEETNTAITTIEEPKVVTPTPTTPKTTPIPEVETPPVSGSTTPVVDTGSMTDEQKCNYQIEKNHKNFEFKNGQCWDKNNPTAGPLNIDTMMDTSIAVTPVPDPIPPAETDNAWAYGLIGAGTVVALIAGGVSYQANEGYKASKKLKDGEFSSEAMNRYFAKTVTADSDLSFKGKGFWDLTKALGNNIAFANEKAVNSFHGLMQGKLRPDVGQAPSENLIKRYNLLRTGFGVAALAGVLAAGIGAILLNSKSSQGLVGNDLLDNIKRTAKEIRKLRADFVENGEKINELLDK